MARKGNGNSVECGKTYNKRKRQGKVYIVKIHKGNNYLLQNIVCLNMNLVYVESTSRELFAKMKKVPCFTFCFVKQATKTRKAVWKQEKIMIYVEGEKSFPFSLLPRMWLSCFQATYFPYLFLLQLFHKNPFKKLENEEILKSLQLVLFHSQLLMKIRFSILIETSPENKTCLKIFHFQVRFDSSKTSSTWNLLQKQFF